MPYGINELVVHASDYGSRRVSVGLCENAVDVLWNLCSAFSMRALRI